MLSGHQDIIYNNILPSSYKFIYYTFYIFVMGNDMYLLSYICLYGDQLHFKLLINIAINQVPIKYLSIIQLSTYMYARIYNIHNIPTCIWYIISHYSLHIGRSQILQLSISYMLYTYMYILLDVQRVSLFYLLCGRYSIFFIMPSRIQLWFLDLYIFILTYIHEYVCYPYSVNNWKQNGSTRKKPPRLHMGKKAPYQQTLNIQ